MLKSSCTIYNSCDLGPRVDYLKLPRMWFPVSHSLKCIRQYLSPGNIIKIKCVVRCI